MMPFLFLLLALDSEASHELVHDEVKGAGVPREHKFVNVSPRFTVFQVLRELIDCPVVHDDRLWSTIRPGGRFEVTPVR